MEQELNHKYNTRSKTSKKRQLESGSNTPTQNSKAKFQVHRSC